MRSSNTRQPAVHNIGGGRPGVSQGDFGSTEYIWLEKMLSLTGSSTEVAVCVSSVRVSKRQGVLTLNPGLLYWALLESRE